jgi:hypothetical protein
MSPEKKVKFNLSMSPLARVRKIAKDDLFKTIPEHPFMRKSTKKNNRISFGEDSFEEQCTPYLAGEATTDLQQPKEAILATQMQIRKEKYS